MCDKNRNVILYRVIKLDELETGLLANKEVGVQTSCNHQQSLDNLTDPPTTSSTTKSRKNFKTFVISHISSGGRECL